MSKDETVERVARALAAEASTTEMGNAGFNAIHRKEYVEVCWRDHEDRARAALSAMPERELWIGDMMIRHAPNGIWIGRRGGEGGEFATEHVERVIAQFYRENF